MEFQLFGECYISVKFIKQHRVNSGRKYILLDFLLPLFYEETLVVAQSQLCIYLGVTMDSAT